MQWVTTTVEFLKATAVIASRCLSFCWCLPHVEYFLLRQLISGELSVIPQSCVRTGHQGAFELLHTRPLSYELDSTINCTVFFSFLCLNFVTSFWFPFYKIYTILFYSILHIAIYNKNHYGKKKLWNIGCLSTMRWLIGHCKAAISMIFCEIHVITMDNKDNYTNKDYKQW